MIATKLEFPPHSGLFREYRFDAFGECTWMKFESDNETCVGVFGNGPLAKSESKVLLFADNKHAFILASGQGYVVQLGDFTLSYKTISSSIYQLMAAPAHNLMVASMNTSIALFGPHGRIWQSNRIAQDELKIESVDNDVIAGRYWQQDRYLDFTLSISDQF